MEPMKPLAWMSGALRVSLKGTASSESAHPAKPSASGEVIRTKARFLVSTTSCFREKTDAGPPVRQKNADMAWEYRERP